MSKPETNPNPERGKGTERRTMLEEIAVYTVKDDKIARGSFPLIDFIAPGPKTR